MKARLVRVSETKSPAEPLIVVSFAMLHIRIIYGALSSPLHQIYMFAKIKGNCHPRQPVWENSRLDSPSVHIPLFEVPPASTHLLNMDWFARLSGSECNLLSLLSVGAPMGAEALPSREN